jgi:SWI/SNF-related matrix-associated actin-dependent regulator of chromatin subfamily A3
MSARRRQEAIERFSIPLEDDGLGAIQEECSVPARTSRLKTRKTRVEDSESQENDSDDEFVDDGVDDDDDIASSTRRKKGKGSCCSKSLKSQFGGENPKVMLLSLKCGSLGLNLTVANNVYLLGSFTFFP